MPKRRWRLAATWLAIGALGAAPVAATSAQRSREYEVKAVQLFAFLKFVQWPAASLGPPRAPFTICLAGRDPFGAVLDQVVAGETVKDHPLVIERLTEDFEIGSCRLVFVPSPPVPRATMLLKAPADGVLWVGEAPGFLEGGGHIRFLIVGGQVKFDLNLRGAAAKGFTVSSKLAQLAHAIVSSADRGSR